jgi:hypothetical protein
VEANEISGQMIAAIHGILQHINPSSLPASRNIMYPYIHYPLSNSWRFESRYEGVPVPYINDLDQIIYWLSTETRPRRLNFRYGDFIKLYGNNSSSVASSPSFDVLITCFFIDTLPISIPEVIKIFSFQMRPDSDNKRIWINVGPLQYHSNASIPYCFEDILSIAESYGFFLLSHKTIETTYCGEEEQTMKPEYYRIPYTVFEFKGIPVSDGGMKEQDSLEVEKIWPIVDFTLVQKWL